MGYTSFSENKISATLVSEYIVYIIMKYREPRFLEVISYAERIKINITLVVTRAPRELMYNIVISP